MALLCSSRTVLSLFLGCADGKTSQTWPLNQNCLPREGGGSSWNGHSPGSCSDRESKAGPALRDGLGWARDIPSFLTTPKGLDSPAETPPDGSGHRDGTGMTLIGALNNVIPPGLLASGLVSLKYLVGG